MHYDEIVSLYSLMAPSRLGRACTIMCKCVFTLRPLLDHTQAGVFRSVLLPVRHP